jgi:prepilin peptidase CpaA
LVAVPLSHTASPLSGWQCGSATTKFDVALYGAFPDDNQAELAGIQRLASGALNKATESAAAVAAIGMAVNFMNTWNALVVAFVVTAAVSDACTRKIPRVLTTFGVLAGLLYHALAGGFGSSVAATIIAFAVGLTFFCVGAIAGGDVKLISALGSMLGLERWILAMEAAVFAAALIGLVQVTRSGALIRTLKNMGEISKTIIRTGLKAHPVLNANNPNAIRSPFGIAAALGTVLAVVVR